MSRRVAAGTRSPGPNAVPPMRTVPEAAGSMNAAMRSRVDFPAPEGALSATSSPAGTLSETPFQQRCRPLRTAAARIGRRVAERDVFKSESRSKAHAPAPSRLWVNSWVGCAEHGLRRAGLNDPARLHHRHLVGKAPRQPDVVGDHDDGAPRRGLGAQDLLDDMHGCQHPARRWARR